MTGPLSCSPNPPANLTDGLVWEFVVDWEDGDRNGIGKFFGRAIELIVELSDLGFFGSLAVNTELSFCLRDLAVPANRDVRSVEETRSDAGR